MNTHIKELIQRATKTRYTGLGEIDELDAEKLAELIVRECIDILDDEVDDDTDKD